MGSHEVGRDGSSAAIARGLCGQLIVGAGAGRRRRAVESSGQWCTALQVACKLLLDPMIAVA